MKLTEHLEQSTVIEWANLSMKKYPELQLLFAVPNGSSRDSNPRKAAIIGRKLKDEGVKKGVPDLCLPVARSGFNGLFIEMKLKPNKLSLFQENWLINLRKQNYAAFVCWSSGEAIALLQDYLNGKKF